MVKDLNKITVGEYSRVISTNKPYPILVFKLIPGFLLFLFEKKISRRLNEISELLNGEQLEDSTEVWKTMTLNKINLLSLLYFGIVNLLHNREICNQFLIDIKKKRKPAGNLEYYFEKVNELAGIEINNLIDVQRLKNEIDRMITKYKEVYPDDEQDTSIEISFVKLLFSVHTILNIPVNYDLLIIDFPELKKLASEKSQKATEMLNKYRNGRDN